MKARLYYESHVTIEPVFDDERERAHVIASRHGFKLAKLLMQKRTVDTPERSKHDTFMTSHGTDSEDIIKRTQDVVIELIANGFRVWRYKVEDTLLDSRNEDELKLLS